MSRPFAPFVALLAAPALMLSLAAPLAAQAEMTEEEISAAFAKQKTRGLSIAPAAQPAATAGSTTVAPATAPEAAQVAYQELPEAEQVNINIAFDFDSAALRPDQAPKLAALCNAMKAATDVPSFKVLGHTDASGSAAYNERLSLLRAQEVKRHLVSDCGIEEGRLIAVGVGENFPLDRADPRADANRRVEFQVGS